MKVYAVKTVYVDKRGQNHRVVVVLYPAPVYENIQVLNTSRHLRLDKVIEAGKHIVISSLDYWFGPRVHDRFASFTRMDVEVILPQLHIILPAILISSSFTDNLSFKHLG